MSVRFTTLASAIAFALVAFGGTSSAQATAPAAPNFNAQLLVGGSDRNDPAVAWLGLQVRLGTGWHTYWRSPGDAGAPPEFDWSGSTNVAAATVEWPAPRRFTDAGIDTIGYADEVVFPIKLRLQEPQRPAKVSLKLALYVCSTICTRNDLSFEANLAAGQQSEGPLELIDQWRARVPRQHSPVIAIRSLQLKTTDPAALQVEATSTQGFATPDVFVDGDTAIQAGRPEIAMTDANHASFTLPLEGIERSRTGKSLSITLVANGNAVEATLPLTQPEATTASLAAPAPSNPVMTSTTWPILAIALLGGLILNFMPCVFPVLSLKIVSLLGQSQHDSGTVRTRFLASAAGVVASFLMLAGTLAALKGAGAQIGWGIQFQQPAFLIAMTAILIALCANLLDLYEIRLPGKLSNLFGGSGNRPSTASYFVNGLIMTLLATPCSAPFVGTAVGFALSQGTWQIFEIFTALGIGMASPYLLLALAPHSGRLLPRPGRWMLIVRRLAAAALAGTAVWLLWILGEISGARIALGVGASLGLIMWAIAVYQRKHANAIAGAVMITLAAAMILTAEPQASPNAAANTAVPWRPLSPQDVGTMVRSGRTVFVDVSAAWCVTCKVNEQLIINSEPIRQRLLTDIVPLQGDWTKPNATIAAYLKSFGRFGLPFNAVFGPGAPEGIVLPEILTQEAVLAAFEAASAHP